MCRIKIIGVYDNQFVLEAYSGDLNSRLVQYSDHGDLCPCQMVCYSYARYHGSSVFRSPFGEWTVIHTTIWTPDQVKVGFSDVGYSDLLCRYPSQWLKGKFTQWNHSWLYFFRFQRGLLWKYNCFIEEKMPLCTRFGLDQHNLFTTDIFEIAWHDKFCRPSGPQNCKHIVKNVIHKESLINDVMQIWTLTDPLPPPPSH